MSEDRIERDRPHGYGRGFRVVEILSIGLFFSLEGLVALRLWAPARAMPWLVLAAVAAGFIVADFVSGFVHWAADTWGSVKMPLLGKTLLRPFREHHVDPKAMTRHDYVETNGSNCLIALPWAAGALVMPLGEGPWLAARVFAMTTIGSMIFWVMMTNQIHKWSHFEPGELPAIVRWAQRVHLILPPAHHDLHHTAPFDTYYCITTGWLNWPLTRLGFFKALERLGSALTGLVPRSDDLGLRAAGTLAPAAHQHADDRAASSS